MRILLGFILALSVSFAQSDSVSVVVQSHSMSNFCKTKTIICPTNRPSQDRYNGMQGEIATTPIAQEFERDIYEVKMKDGSSIFYSSIYDDFFVENSGLITLEQHLKATESKGTSIIDGGSVTVDSVVMDESGIGYKYKLSTGQEIWGDTFGALKSFLPNIPSEHEESFVRIIDHIKISHDKVEDRFFISISPSLADISDMRIAISPYIVFQNEKPEMIIRFSYDARDWLFANKVLVKADDDKRVFEDLRFNRDSSAYTISEWHDKRASKDDIRLVNSIAESNETIVRFYGKQGYDDKSITPNQKKRLKEVLWVYSVLGGGLSE